MASCGGYQNQAVGRSKRKRETATSTSLDGVCWGEAFPPAKFKKENTPKTFEITALYRVAHFPVSSCPVRISSLNFLGRLQTDSGNNKQTSERTKRGVSALLNCGDERENTGGRRCRPNT